MVSTRASRRHLASILEDRINQIRRLEIMMHRLYMRGYDVTLEDVAKLDGLRSHCGRLGNGGAK